MRNLRGNGLGNARPPEGGVPAREPDRHVEWATRAGDTDHASGAIILIEKRALIRECLTRSLRFATGQDVQSFSRVDSWIETAGAIPASLVILCLATHSRSPETQSEISALFQAADGLPVTLLSDVEDPDEIVEALDLGVRGFIPTSVPLDVAVEAMRLVKAGGVYIPASSLFAARRSADSENVAVEKLAAKGQFTARQAAVVEALRRGKANKIIAYELNMRESTVKVHVRNIMKKLHAKNRTEVAFLTNGMMHPES